jgi:uncharacterized protein (TIGR00162 family)
MSAPWKTTIIKKINIKNSILIEGMPGIGNVGKIAADMLVDQLKAQKIASFFSYCLPNSVFVKENNLVELPQIELFYKKIGKKEFLFLLGDVQPMEPEDSYLLTEAILLQLEKYSCKEIIALGGIGLQDEPVNPKLYCTGNDKSIVDEFTKLGVNGKLYGFVGPIMGVTGLLLGLSKKMNIRALALLSETSVQPMHIGLREAKELISLLEKKYKLGLSISKIEKNISKLEQGIKPILKQQELGKEKNEPHSDTSYIG